MAYAWTTSWGVSTRLIGALIMTHSDDDGLVLPPKLAPSHVVILPIYATIRSERSTQLLPGLRKELSAQSFADQRIEVSIDDRDMRGGEKKWFHVKRGVPLRVEVGPKTLLKMRSS